MRPNPAVGAVIVRGGKIVGEGWHKKAGEDHAETAAIKDALRKSRGKTLEGSTIYVTLEPCSRPGRVGACTDAVIAAGISKVVYAVRDPNAANRGRAKRIFAAHGMECECWETDLRKKKLLLSGAERSSRMDCVREAKRLIAPFAKHVTTSLPFVTVKIAMSLDGKICDEYGDAKWVSSPDSRRRTGLMRECVDAIMVGAETLRKDDPSLLSHAKANADLVRVIVSRSGRLPPRAQVFTDGKNKTLVFDDARKALCSLGEMGMTHVLCEGGLSLARSLAEMNLVDEWMCVLSPVVIGSRPIKKAFRLKSAPTVEIPSARFGDVIVSYCPERRGK